VTGDRDGDPGGDRHPPGPPVTPATVCNPRADDVEQGSVHVERSSLGALGIGVSDLDRSVDRYTRVLGMQRLMTFTLPYMDEVLEVTREPTPVPELGDAVVGLAKDPDGYVIELLQRPPRPGADAATAGTTTA